MNKNNEQLIAIKFCFKAGKGTTETFEMLKVAYGGSVMSHATVFRWYNLFANGRELIEDDEKSGRPCDTRSNENISKVAAVLKDHLNVGCKLLEKLTGIPKTIVQHIIKDDLKEKKAVRIFVPHTLTAEQRVSHAHL